MKGNRGSSESTISIAVSNFQQFPYFISIKQSRAEELGPKEEDVGPVVRR